MSSSAGQSSQAGSSTTTTSGAGAAPCKKRRTALSQHQLVSLEAAFFICQYPHTLAKKELATDIGLKPEVVNHWFQNKRSKERKNISRSLRVPSPILLASPQLIKYRKNTIDLYSVM